MKKQLRLIYCSVLSCTLISCGSGAATATQNSGTTTNFAAQISQLQLSTPHMRAIQTQLVNYYSKVHPSLTLSQNGITLDCIPFKQQPALIFKSAAELAKIQLPAVKTKSESARTQINQQLLFSPDACPANNVAVVRPQIANLQKGLSSAFGKDPSANGLSAYDWVLANESTNVSPSNYDLTNLNPQSTLVMFDAGFNPLMNMPVIDGSHIINQSWWTTQSPQAYLMTLETGLIKSAYFSESPAVTFFAFSTVSGYGPGPAGGCYNLECGDFIQYPNTPALGVPLTPQNGKYTFSYRAFALGYELTISFISNDNIQNSWTYPIGYYPNSRYNTNNPLTNNPFVLYSGGAEIETGNNIDQYQIDGTLYGLFYNMTNLLPIDSTYNPRNNPLYAGNLIWDPTLNNNIIQFYTIGSL